MANLVLGLDAASLLSQAYTFFPLTPIGGVWSDGTGVGNGTAAFGVIDPNVWVSENVVVAFKATDPGGSIPVGSIINSVTLSYVAAGGDASNNVNYPYIFGTAGIPGEGPGSVSQTVTGPWTRAAFFALATVTPVILTRQPFAVALLEVAPAGVAVSVSDMRVLVNYTTAAGAEWFKQGTTPEHYQYTETAPTSEWTESDTPIPVLDESPVELAPHLEDVAEVRPPSGAEAGGTLVVITGSGFDDNADIFFGATPATVVTINSEMIFCTTPAHGVGFVDVEVVNGDGQSDTATDGFQYIHSSDFGTLVVNPATGSSLGGELVRISGTNFSGTTTVQFGLNSATNVTVVSATLITVRTPAVSDTVGELLNVTVQNATRTGIAVDAFTFTAPTPTVHTIQNTSAPATAPPSASTLGGTALTAYGDGFSPTTVVYLGDQLANDIVVLDNFRITLTAPPIDIPDEVEVTVVTP